MALYRFGSALIRLERVIGSKVLPPDAGCEVGKTRVYFEGRKAIDLDGVDAAAFREFTSDQPPPPREESRPAAQPGRQARKLISPADHKLPRGGRKDVPGA